MIKHIVLFKLEESEHKNVRLQEIRDRLEALVQVIPELKEMQVGINVNPEEKWDFSLEAVVADLHALEVYANHPAHQEIDKTFRCTLLDISAAGNRQNFNRTGQSGQGVCRLPVLIDLISGNTLPRVLAQPRKKQELCKKQYLSPSCYWGFYSMYV